jgi:hypothetical protein
MPFYQVDLLDWAVISIKNHRRYMDDFVNTILRIAPPMGMRIKEPTRVSLDNDRTSTYVRALQNVIEPNVNLYPQYTLSIPSIYTVSLLHTLPLFACQTCLIICCMSDFFKGYNKYHISYLLYN